MEENKVENNIEVNGTENKTEGTTSGEIVEIKQPGIGKKILKGVAIGLSVTASFIAGLLLGGRNKGDDNDSTESEGPKDE